MWWCWTESPNLLVTSKILDNAHARIERGDKIALIGANGKGKSTVLRIIDGSEPIQGHREDGYNVIKSFFCHNTSWKPWV